MQHHRAFVAAALLAAAATSAWPATTHGEEMEPPIEHNYTLGMRSAFGAAFSEQDYVAAQLSPLGPTGDVTRTGGIGVAIFFSYRRLHLELEGYLDSKLTLVGDTTFTEVEPGQASIGGWLRFAAFEKAFGRPPGARTLQNHVSVQPGVSVAHTSASVDAWPRDPMDSPRSLLEKKETTYAIGVLVEVLFFRGLGASVDYRYRFAKMTGATPENEGTAIFPPPAEFDFSGHVIFVGMLYRAPFNLFR
ncbi:MAG: hypothetical protein OEO21_09710 [Candidatus Krumholzibacteria bacterium]|nr:hypothetical protein [Candidatus Krumholzibacteria bacterium]